jgi:hypothetical protein
MRVQVVLHEVNLLRLWVARCQLFHIDVEDGLRRGLQQGSDVSGYLPTVQGVENASATEGTS